MKPGLRATESNFQWGGGKHSRRFTHGRSSLPELALNTRQNYFQSFCTRLCRHYNDKVHFAFLSAHSMAKDGEGTAEQTKSTDRDFVLGENVVYVDGKGGVETVVYEGATPSGTQHVVRWQDGSKIFVYPSHLRFQQQAGILTKPV